jgi:hypothetical protein
VTVHAHIRRPLASPARFVLEASLIVAVGAIAVVLDLAPFAIVLVLALALVVVAAVVERAVRPEAERAERSDQATDPSAGSEPAPEPRRRLRLSAAQTAAQPAAESGASNEWNLWELERRARDYAGPHAVPEEWAATFMYLREFAKSDGQLPSQFDSLVRDSFPELTWTAT